MDLNPKELIKNFDLDGSGTVSEKEIELSKELIEISLREVSIAEKNGVGCGRKHVYFCSIAPDAFCSSIPIGYTGISE